MDKNMFKSRIVIPCRFAYINCWRPSVQYGGIQKYSVSALISKEDIDTINKIEEVIEHVKEQSVQKWGGRIPANIRLPLHDGDVEKPDNPIFQNCYYLNAKSKDAPQVVDRNVHPITNQTEIYSGCYGNISITLYGYNFSGTKGIAAWLGNIQKIRDGEPFGRRIVATDDFEPIGGEDFLQ
ncbi:MAG: DUF2815 family protein [Lachnospiraceae bacterium]|nr:DUF2815 family protein [Lachnospiraceae bacterium]